MRVAGVEYDIDWKKFKNATSLYFPCLDYAEAREEVGKEMKRLKFNVLIKNSIEDGIKGLRVWRIRL